MKIGFKLCCKRRFLILSSILQIAGLSDPEMRAMVRHNLLNPKKPVAQAGVSHIFLWVAAVALVGVLLALALSVWYFMKRWVS